MKFKRTRLACLLLLAPAFLFAQTENIDHDMMQRIRKEGLENSKIMDIAFHLTDVNGPRLIASPGFLKAANWAKNQLTQWGLVNATLDPWGEFGKGWELQKSYIAMTAPWYRSIQAYPKVWSDGSGGLKNAQLFLISANDSAAFSLKIPQLRGKVNGKVIILDRNDSYAISFKPDARRYTDDELNSMAKLQPARAEQSAGTTERSSRQEQMRTERTLLNAVKTFAREEGAIAVFSTSLRNRDGTVFVQQAGPYKVSDPANFLDVAIGYEDYMTMVRLLRNNILVNINVDVLTKFYTSDTKGYNVIAEIKGTDPKLMDEIVMLGGHLDSWAGSTGATDNAAGCAVMMEAVRILKTLGISPKRTIRIALWGAEEQGLFGSREYVKKTFADPSNMKLLPAHEKLSVYLNLDNGTGKIRGIYAQGNEAAKNIFTQWFVPFHDLGAKTVTVSNTGSTDHISFDAVGLPGFQFIQDPVEYSTRTHHSNMDSYDHLIEADLKHSATIVAAFVYNAAMRDKKMPRKDLPKPRSAGQR